MRVVYSLPEAQLHKDSVVTIGAFDGVHRGHQVVIDSVRRSALAQNRASVVVTFFPHPGVVLGRAEPFYLTSTEEKIAVLEPMGIDLLAVMAFTIEMSHTRAADYVSMLIDHLRMREVHVGYDFAFGYKREGTVDFLKRSGDERGFRVRAIDPLTNGDEPISSTAIRQALRAGDVAAAAKWLGRPFRLNGAAMQGEDAHPSIIRLDVWQDHAIPADGAYACEAQVGGSKFSATAAIGTQPDASKPLRTIALTLPGLQQRIDGLNVALDFIQPAETSEVSKTSEV
jgi:riboflavin kinase/FMN adenylyltransferase